MDRIKNKKTIGGIALAAILVAGMFTFMPQSVSADLTALDKFGTIINMLTDILDSVETIEQNFITCDGSPGTIFGTTGADTITDTQGTPGNDVVITFTGDDTITLTEGGDDKICSGPDNDTITAGGGANFIDGDIGNDTITAGDGSGDGNNIIYGRDGNDTLTGGSGNDAIFGAGGNDTITGSDGNDFMTGDDGDDTLTGSGGNDTADGGPGPNDTCTAENESNCEI